MNFHVFSLNFVLAQSGSEIKEKVKINKSSRKIGYDIEYKIFPNATLLLFPEDLEIRRKIEFNYFSTFKRNTANPGWLNPEKI